MMEDKDQKISQEVEMDENQRNALLERYQAMSTEELVDIYSKGTLTEVATQVMAEVLSARGVSVETMVIIESDLKAESSERLASIEKRFLAQLLDNLVAISIAIVCFVLGNTLLSDAGWLGLAGYLCYYLLSDGLQNGQSLGKKAMKIAVVNIKTGKPCSYLASAARNTTMLFLGILDIVFVLGRTRRRLGDFAADTEVINFAK